MWLLGNCIVDPAGQHFVVALVRPNMVGKSAVMRLVQWCFGGAALSVPGILATGEDVIDTSDVTTIENSRWC